MWPQMARKLTQQSINLECALSERIVDEVDGSGKHLECSPQPQALSLAAPKTDGTPAPGT